MTKAFKKERISFFALSILVYFVPFLIVTAIFFPSIDASPGKKWTIGIALLVINAFPFVKNLFASIFVHFPMINVFSIIFLMLATFFCSGLFQYYVEIFLWIEATALVGSIFSCIFWIQYKKYTNYAKWNNGYNANLKAGNIK